jgi:HEPN domain-containing protein
MPPERPRADAPVRWLEYARADLALARAPLPPGGLYEQLCFHAQQVAEKSLKAVLLQEGVEFPFTHNVQALFDLLATELQVPPQILHAVVLTRHAVTTRYPGEMEPVTEDEYRQAIRLAERVVQWAEEIIRRGGSRHGGQ